MNKKQLWNRVSGQIRSSRLTTGDCLPPEPRTFGAATWLPYLTDWTSTQTAYSAVQDLRNRQSTFCQGMATDNFFLLMGSYNKLAITLEIHRNSVCDQTWDCQGALRSRSTRAITWKLWNSRMPVSYSWTLLTLMGCLASCLHSKWPTCWRNLYNPLNICSPSSWCIRWEDHSQMAWNWFCVVKWMSFGLIGWHLAWRIHGGVWAWVLPQEKSPHRSSPGTTYAIKLTQVSSIYRFLTIFRGELAQLQVRSPLTLWPLSRPPLHGRQTTN